MVSWSAFSDAEPELAGAGRALLYQYGVGLAFLATVRQDGGPRVHPMCPLIDDAGLYAFLIPSPKRDDLHRDGRYAMHSFPADENEDAFSVRGRARPIEYPETRRALERQFREERKLPDLPDGFEEQELFVFGIESCLHTVTTGHGDPAPSHRVWKAP
jgi:Pyridoxamine 5'-phosphate oxidase